MAVSYDRRLGYIVFTALLPGLIGASLTAHQGSPAGLSHRSVSGALSAAAESDRPVTFAAAMASAEIPGGIILAAGERTTVDGSFAAATGRQSTSLAEAVGAFTGRHSAYTARQMNDVVVVQPRTATPCTVALRRSIGPVTIEGELHNALNDLFVRLNPEHPRVPPGIISGGAGSRDESSPYLTLPVAAGTVMGVFNAIATHRPGFVWVMREHVLGNGRQACVFEYFYKNSRLSTGWFIPADSN